MKLKTLAIKFTANLQTIYSKEEAHAIFLIVIAKLLQYSKNDYLLRKEEELPKDTLDKLEIVLEKLAQGIPVQYILGETWFYGLPFKVSPAVLIPRPETEELVAWVLEKIPNSISGIELLDIGTGSGCIAIALKKQLPKAKITAIDISSEALTIAQQNADFNKVEVTFVRQDILHTRNELQDTRYDSIVSNPPYITQAEKAEMHQNVLANEPHLALFASQENPLIFYEAIADFASLNLKPEGLLFFEINEYLAQETINLLESKGFNNIELKKDMQGKNRMVCCSHN
ncbi:MAG: peptide chain release factor N(5)-glutamine methyltransferase [Bacteroidota bacterium]